MLSMTAVKECRETLPFLFIANPNASRGRELSDKRSFPFSPNPADSRVFPAKSSNLGY